MSIKSGKLSAQKKNIVVNKLYCLVDGVLTPMVYTEKGEDGNEYYNELMISSPKRIIQISSSAPRHSFPLLTEFNVATTTTTAQKGTVTTFADVTIQPVFLFDYKKQVIQSASRLATWASCYGGFILSNSTSNLAPKLGRKAGGVNEESSIYFDGNHSEGDFVSSSANITMSGDFTLFLHFVYEQEKYIRLLGKSSDANVYVGFNEDANRNFHFGLGSGKTYTISMGDDALTAAPTLITVQRKGTTLTVRKNRKQIGSTTVATDDLVIDQVARWGTSNLTFGGNISYLAGYDGCITTKLVSIERAIINHSQKARL